MDVEVEPLRIDQSDLTTKRMMDLMAVSPDNGPMPLYLHAINRILRELRIEQQESKESFDYTKFKKQVIASEMTAAQLGPLNQRLDTLESFMPAWQTEVDEIRSKRLRKAAKEIGGNDWSVKVCYMFLGIFVSATDIRNSRAISRLLTYPALALLPKEHVHCSTCV
jgi:hypothetical protein